MLVCPHLPGAAESCLDLVADQQRPVLMTERLDGTPVLGLSQMDTFALDRFDEIDGDGGVAKLGLQGVDVAERDLGEPLQQRHKAALKVGSPVRREGAEREAVKRVV